MKTGRKAYMREYMRNRRQQAKTGDVNSVANNAANGELTEARLRAIIREEIERAMGPLRELLTRLTVNSINTSPEPAKALMDVDVNPADPIPYWKPDTSKPRDPRCQSTNRDGSRCKGRGEVLVKALDAEGRLGEFNACPRHQAEFRPHPSMMDRRVDE